MRTISCFERDLVKTAFPVFERVAEVQPIGASYAVADQLAEIPLSGDKANEWNRSFCVLCFDQLDQLLSFLVHKLQVSSVAGQPEDQFVQEENNGIVFK